MTLVCELSLRLTQPEFGIRYHILAQNTLPKHYSTELNQAMLILIVLEFGGVLSIFLIITFPIVRRSQKRRMINPKNTFKFFPNHSSTVSLALNCCTGSVSPQFHIVHIKRFTTTQNFGFNNITALWNELCSVSREKTGIQIL